LKAGGETSLWRVPGGDISAKNWATFNKINWKKDFCKPSSTSQSADLEDVVLSPNPVLDIFQIMMNNDLPTEMRILDLNGRVLLEDTFMTQTSVDISTWAAGFYMCHLTQKDGAKVVRIVKN
jgi:hypothetical protein